MHRRNDGVHSPYDLLFDEMVDTWGTDAQINKNFLSMVQTHASNQLRTRGYLFLNEVYRMIGKYNNGQQITILRVRSSAGSMILTMNLCPTV